jgi:hypothetical protein
MPARFSPDFQRPLTPSRCHRELPGSGQQQRARRGLVLQLASVRRALVAEVLAVCAGCPVQVKCGRYGLELLADDYVVAVYGAMDPGALARSEP